MEISVSCFKETSDPRWIFKCNFRRRIHTKKISGQSRVVRSHNKGIQRPGELLIHHTLNKRTGETHALTCFSRTNHGSGNTPKGTVSRQAVIRLGSKGFLRMNDTLRISPRGKVSFNEINFLNFFLPFRMQMLEHSPALFLPLDLPGGAFAAIAGLDLTSAQEKSADLAIQSLCLASRHGVGAITEAASSGFPGERAVCF